MGLHWQRYLDNATRTLWFLDSHSLASPLTLTVPASLCLFLGPPRTCSANIRGQGHAGLFYETIRLKDRRHIDGPDDASALATLFIVYPISLRPFGPRYYIRERKKEVRDYDRKCDIFHFYKLFLAESIFSSGKHLPLLKFSLSHVRGIFYLQTILFHSFASAIPLTTIFLATQRCFVTRETQIVRVSTTVPELRITIPFKRASNVESRDR